MMYRLVVLSHAFTCPVVLFSVPTEVSVYPSETMSFQHIPSSCVYSCPAVVYFAGAYIATEKRYNYDVCQELWIFPSKPGVSWRRAWMDASPLMKSPGSL